MWLWRCRITALAALAAAVLANEGWVWRAAAPLLLLLLLVVVLVTRLPIVIPVCMWVRTLMITAAAAAVSTVLPLHLLREQVVPGVASIVPAGSAGTDTARSVACRAMMRMLLMMMMRRPGSGANVPRRVPPMTTVPVPIIPRVTVIRPIVAAVRPVTPVIRLVLIVGMVNVLLAPVSLPPPLAEPWGVRSRIVAIAAGPSAATGGSSRAEVPTGGSGGISRRRRQPRLVMVLQCVWHRVRLCCRAAMVGVHAAASADTAAVVAAVHLLLVHYAYAATLLGM